MMYTHTLLLKTLTGSFPRSRAGAVICRLNVSSGFNRSAPRNDAISLFVVMEAPRGRAQKNVLSRCHLVGGAAELIKWYKKTNKKSSNFTFRLIKTHQSQGLRLSFVYRRSVRRGGLRQVRCLHDNLLADWFPWQPACHPGLRWQLLPLPVEWDQREVGKLSAQTPRWSQTTANIFFPSSPFNTNYK